MDLPKFKYHEDPIASGNTIEAAPAEQGASGHNRLRLQ